MSQEIEKITESRGGAFSSIQRFEEAQRMAKVLCASSIVPQSYRENIADCVIALEMANRIGANPLAVMQNLYIVHGRPAWSSQFLISCVNASGKFSPLRYRETGKPSADDWGCVAWAVDARGETLESPEVTLGMAKAEGWFSKNGSKWKTMPQLMLRYRAATLFARLFAPELTMGIQTDDEVIDIAPVVTSPVFSAKPIFATQTPTQPAPEIPLLKPTHTTLAPAPVAYAETKQGQLEKYVSDDCGISFDDFRKFITEKGLSKNSDSWAGWQDVPTSVCVALEKSVKDMAELVKAYGKNTQ